MSSSSSARALALSRRAITSSARRDAITKFAMPAMSPTMTEGGIANWKLKEGDSFAAGDVLLEIETDKATMDVEAQEDGILGKIIISNGAKDVKVGRTIALLAEEGDDISNLEVPAEETASGSVTSEAKPAETPKSTPSPSSLGTGASPASSPSPATAFASSQSHHDEPITGTNGALFPSVSRLLIENGIHDASPIKGTGLRGMITKGDVLAYLGKISSPNGSYNAHNPGISELGPKPKGAIAGGSAGALAGTGASAKPAADAAKPLTAEQLRTLILGGLADASSSARAKRAPTPAPEPPATPASASKKGSMNAGFDALLASYSFGSKKPAPCGGAGKKDPLAGLL